MTLTAQQPLNDVVRGAYQALAAVLGGAQSLHVSGHDEAFCLPTEASARLALRTQQIVQHESGVTAAVDPLGGAPYALERLADELETRARALVAEVEAGGGIVRASETGWLHGRLTAFAEAYRAGVRDGRLPVISVNCFTEGDEGLPQVFAQPAAAAAPGRATAAPPRDPRRRRVPGGAGRAGRGAGERPERVSRGDPRGGGGRDAGRGARAVPQPVQAMDPPARMKAIVAVLGLDSHWRGRSP